jgi:hypothetical protein
MTLYSPLKEWRACVCVWHEFLLQRSVPQLRVELQEEFMLTIPCVDLHREVSEHDVRVLAGLIERWKVQWRGGPATLRPLETTGRVLKRRSVEVRKVADALYVVGDSFCVRRNCILLFDLDVHMRLYLQLVDRELDPSTTFGALCASLSIEPMGLHTEARLINFSNQRVDKLRSPMLWRNLAALMWADVEVVSAAVWRAERGPNVTSIETVVHSAVVLDSLLSMTEPIILVERDAQGRHARCLLVMVRVSTWTENSGSVLFVSYVGYEARVGIYSSTSNTVQ